MKLIHFRLIVFVSPLLLLVGCAAPTYTFQVAVKNETSQPLTLWLTKDGPPSEPAWISPEELSQSTYYDVAPISAVVLNPGDARIAEPTSGKFPAGVHAILRIYDGNLKFSQILATGRDSMLRIDQTLQHEGLNQFVVHNVDGKLHVDEKLIKASQKK